jgi:alpha-2-macroglobulin
MSKISYILGFIFLATFLESCTKSQAKNITSKQELSQYFDAATAGVISTQDELKYILKSGVQINAKEEKDIQKIISTDPKVEGTVSIVNENIVVFKPKLPLQSNQTYKVTLDLPILNKEVFKELIQYELKTKPQVLIIANDGFLIPEKNFVKHHLRVRSSDKLDSTELRKILQPSDKISEIKELKQNEYLVVFTFLKSEYSGKEISYDASSINSNSKGKIKVYELGNTFGVVSTVTDYKTNEVKFYLSRQINNNQDFEGLVTGNGASLNTAVDGNILTVLMPEGSSAVNVNLSEAIRDVDGNQLINAYVHKFEMSANTPDVKLLDKGNYFPSDGAFKIPVKSRALNSFRIQILEIKQHNALHFLAWQSLDYTDMYSLKFLANPVYDEKVEVSQGLEDSDGWTVYGLDLTGLVERNPGSMYHIALDYELQDINLPCADKLKNYAINSQLLDKAFYDRWEESTRDYYYYNDENYNYEGEYDSDRSNDPCSIFFYNNRSYDSRIISCQNHGVIAKKHVDGYTVAITKLKDVSPTSGASVTFYSLQGEELGKSKTDNQGFADLKNNTKDALAIKLEAEGSISFLKLNTNESNDMTTFDVEGERTEEEISYFIYTERGVYRPGDSIYLDLMVNKVDANLPEGLPIIMQFANPDNIILEKQIKNYNSNQYIYHYVLKTTPQAKTGRYVASFTVGSKKVKKYISIENIKPNTTETIFSIGKEEKSVIYDDKFTGSLTTKYLTGFNVTGAKVSAIGRAYRISKPFKNYGSYNFSGGYQGDNTAINLTSGVTNSEGQINFSSDYNFKTLQSPINLNVQVETTLPGGGTSLEGKNYSLYPYDTYVGVKHVSGNEIPFVEKSDELTFELVRLSNKGQLASSSGSVSYTLSRGINTWWISKYSLRSSGYYSNDSEWKTVVSDKATVSSPKQVNFKKSNIEYGAYRLLVVDEISGHTTTMYFNFGSYYYSQDSKLINPQIINVKSDKNEYNVGDNAYLSVPYKTDSKILITVERGNRILDKMWISQNSTEDKIPLTIKPEWAPNVYININQIQSHNQDNNDQSIRSYGVKYIEVNQGSSRLDFKTTAPTEMESNKTYNIDVSEATGKAAQYTFALVDEGLTGLTGFKTPDPHQHFNGKYPLLVKTWDIYSRLMNYYKGVFAGIISIGGDSAYHPDALAEISRFKPVVIHQGVFNLGAGEKKSHKIVIPNYIGKLRLMVVGCNSSAFGSTAKSINVINPLMVQSTFPRSLNVTDKVSVPLTITRTKSNINFVDMTIEADPKAFKGLTQVKKINLSKDLSYDQVNLEVIGAAGKNRINLIGKSGALSMSEQTDIAINYPNSFQTKSNTIAIEPGKSYSFLPKTIGFPEKYGVKATVHGIKLPNVVRMVDQILMYPYGCLEQTTSGAFSQLYLDKIISLSPNDLAKQGANLDGGANRILKFMSPKGSFNYWENGYYNLWSDLYAGNFLVEYQKLKSNATIESQLNKWIKYHTKSANDWTSNQTNEYYSYQENEVCQAYRLFILAKAGKPAKSAMNRLLSQSKNLDAITMFLLSGAYQLSGMDSKATELLARAEAAYVGKVDNYSYSLGSRASNLGLITEVVSCFPNLKTKTRKYFEAMVDQLGKSWYSTHDIGYAILATYKTLGTVDVSKRLKATFSLGSEKQNIDISQSQSYFKNFSQGTTLSVKNEGLATIYLTIDERFIPSQPILEAKSSNLSMNIVYYNETQKIDGLKGVKLGDDLSIVVNLQNLDVKEYDDLALNLKMPSGFELLNPRVTNAEYCIANAIYQDYKDDRVYTFLKLGPSQGQTFRFKAKAAFKGDFYLPTTRCESMYDGNTYAESKSDRVVIN